MNERIVNLSVFVSGIRLATADDFTQIERHNICQQQRSANAA